MRLATLLEGLKEDSCIGGNHKSLSKKSAVELVFHVSFGVEIA